MQFTFATGLWNKRTNDCGKMSLDDGMKKIGHLPPFWNLQVSVLFKKLDYIILLYREV